ncbi:MAG: hypothetical protein NTY35_13595 [Planctomycetota bacterium]|nr:hypothetical protein [Planctomycetota bacterium]
MRIHIAIAPFAVCVLAAAAQAGRLIAVDTSRALYDVDIATGAKTLIGTVSAGAGTPSGLTRDPASGTIYLCSSSVDSLFRLDIATGSATVVGPFGSTTIVMHGLEWDSGLNTLWGASNGNLFQISPTSGAAMQVGTSGLTSFTNLGYVPATDTLYAASSSTDSLLTVNRSTGAMATIGPFGAGAANSSGLAYDTDNGVMYMIDSTADNLYTVNLGTGAATVVGPTGTGSLQGLVYIPGTTPLVPFCFGDGSGTACPCANAGAPGNGCANSVAPGGANMTAMGNASIANDTVVLQGTGMPNNSALYFQGTAQQSSGNGAVFGDGLRCASGTIIRLATKPNVGGSSQYPTGPEFSVSFRGQCTPGAVRSYQIWYRNAAAFCTPSTFNLTNGLQITWLP